MNTKLELNIDKLANKAARYVCTGDWGTEEERSEFLDSEIANLFKDSLSVEEHNRLITDTYHLIESLSFAHDYDDPISILANKTTIYQELRKGIFAVSVTSAEHVQMELAFEGGLEKTLVLQQKVKLNLTSGYTKETVTTELPISVMEFHEKGVDSDYLMEKLVLLASRNYEKLFKVDDQRNRYRRFR